MVGHIRWDLKQIFALAVAEGLVQRNSASLLFIPKQARRPAKLVMSFEEVRKAFQVFDLRERLTAKLAILAGLRPGEIFGLTWVRLQGRSAKVRQRVYKGQVDTPKTANSNREVALPNGLHSEINEWRKISVDTRPQAWVFPSETMRTPMSKDNCWRRLMARKLKAVGLRWVNFQVIRRTHSTLMKRLKINPKVVADQLGHSLDVNQNISTQVPTEQKMEAVNELESVLVLS
jgi:integrase